MLTVELLEKAKVVENDLVHSNYLLEDGNRNNDTINILIVSYVQGFDWSHGFEIIADNAELFNPTDLMEQQMARENMGDEYQEFVHDEIGRSYSRLEWVENIISNNPNNWEEILISKLM